MKKDYRKIYKEYLSIDWDSKKYEVHHIDMNRENNDIKNLILLPKNIHRKLHSFFDRFRCYGNLLNIDNFEYIYITDDLYKYFEIKKIVFQQIINRNCVLNGLDNKLYIKYLEELDNGNY